MSEQAFVLFHLTQKLPIMFCFDRMGLIFAAITALIWVLCGLYSFAYFKGDKKAKRYAIFYVITLIVILCLDFAGNLITFYLFYELMTLLSVPLVFHNETKEALMAALKYLFYSLCGAYMALFGLYFVYRNAETIRFTPGGVLAMSVTPENQTILLISVLSMILGFSVKAGMLPMHAWLTSAHPVAPAPASAFLSGIIVKGGVLGIIRTVFYIAGPDLIRDTFVQYILLTLSIATVFLGSMLAYREKQFKRRLAYSTVSQVSYILFGIFLLNPVSLTGSLLHVIFHAVIKSALFLCAGIVIHETGKEYVNDLPGIGKQMPGMLWCFAIVSMGLVGIPPLSGFISKWYLCVGSLEEGISVYSYLGPVMLLVSALLTAGYLLPIVIKGFIPGEGFDDSGAKRIHVSLWMMVPVLILAGLTIVLGIAPGMLTGVFKTLADTLM
ncbi:MAG: proton-conducting membrane transporter [Lachnospiraceae bacterium]|nr:proton-conducting membrane transporter [Lachnospiraceae bacterium]